MDLKYQILKEHTKENCTKIIQWVGGDKKRFNELVQLFLNEVKIFYFLF